jgi:hypothetical protein
VQTRSQGCEAPKVLRSLSPEELASKESLQHVRNVECNVLFINRLGAFCIR